MSATSRAGATKAVSSLTEEGAGALIEAAVRHAREKGMAISVAVHDSGAHLLGFRRMDAAPVVTIEIAQNKSYSAAGYGLPTHQWYDLIKDDEPLKLGIVHTSRLVTFGGGYPVTASGEVVGGLGISGGHYSQDMEVATLTLRELGYDVA